MNVVAPRLDMPATLGNRMTRKANPSGMTVRGCITGRYLLDTDDMHTKIAFAIYYKILLRTR
jgi:hypothetical protein